MAPVANATARRVLGVIIWSVIVETAAPDMQAIMNRAKIRPYGGGTKSLCNAGVQ